MLTNHDILKQTEKHLADIVSIRRDIHQHPEIGFDVQRTASIVARELKNIGLEVIEGVGKTGVVSNISSPKHSQLIALRADMDALPMQELNNVSYKSLVDGKAHTCGHDAHTAMLIGAARIIKQFESELKTNVRLIFQPSEEAHPGGALEMIKDGALDGVDEIYGLHVWPLLHTGQIGIANGPSHGQSDRFTVILKGKGGHPAFPHLASDVIVAGSQFVTLVQSFVSRDVDPFDSSVISITQFHAGEAANTLPSVLEISGSVRTISEKTQEFVEKKIKRLLEGIASTHGLSLEFTYKRGYPVSINHKEPTEKAVATARKLIGAENLIFPFSPILGGEDFAYYTQKTPACYFFVGVGNKSNTNIMNHHPQFDIDEKGMLYGTAMYTALALTEKIDK